MSPRAFAVGHGVIFQAGLLTSGSSSSRAFPALKRPVASSVYDTLLQDLSPVTAAGPSRNYTGFPFHPHLRTPENCHHMVQNPTPEVKIKCTSQLHSQKEAALSRRHGGELALFPPAELLQFGGRFPEQGGQLPCYLVGILMHLV